MVFLERAITSFLLTGSDNFVKLFYSVDEAALNTIPLPMTQAAREVISWCSKL
jgi:hypothetical protein